MRRRPLGCLTATGLLFAAATALLLACASILTGNDIFSPGPLNAESGAAIEGVRSHAELSGDCGACHTAIWSGETMANRCVVCHEQVREELAAGTGLHGRYAMPGECRTCHTDHRGAAVSLTLPELPEFPHERTGYSLLAHPVGGSLFSEGFDCADCHPRSVTAFEPTTCSACHERLDREYLDAHVETFARDCRACHDGVDTYGAQFDHGAWRLDGEHANAPCAACHAGATDVVGLRAADTACMGCHASQDPHDGRLGADCGACHTTAGWDTATDTFDHAMTAFALTGRHTEVACLACHVDRAWTGIGTTCEACHGGADDPHRGQFAQSCAACHTTGAWDAVTFDHATTAFALGGAHAEATCESCHDEGRFAGTPTACSACHQDDDAHEGNVGKACQACHRASTWDDTTFDHDEARFVLTGRHMSIQCTTCHQRLTMYRGTPTTCFACHRDDDRHNRTLGTDCSACHSTRTWDGADFDHARTGFRLTGAHADTSCAACHPGNSYQDTPRTCFACHRADDRHGGAFGTTCGACHTTRSWSGATVDHDTTDFPLTGAHRGVACGKCHANDTYQGTPTACSACHRKPGSHEPKAFSSCASCHTTRAWRPADYDASHPFPMSHRNADGVCSRCHPATWASYSCASCHSNATMDEHHKEVTGYTRTTCAECHPTGRNP